MVTRLAKNTISEFQCKGLLMSSEGKTISEIAAFTHKTPRTIRNWFNAFEAEGLSSLGIRRGRGIKAKLDNVAKEQLDLIKKEIKRNAQNIKTACVRLRACGEKSSMNGFNHWTI
jgi:transposase